MAPINQKTEKKTFARKEGNWKNSKNAVVGVKKKRKWVPEHKKFFEGSVKEGQGFAFQRKQMVRYEYNKLKRKQEKNKTTQALYKEEYPEHLRHLYEAEAQKLKKEAWENRVKRSKKRMMGREEAQEDEVEEDEAAAPQTTGAAPSPKDAAQPPAAGPQSEDTGGSELTEKPEAETQRESLPMSNRMKKKLQKKTSYQKTKEEYEEVKEKKRKKKEEFLKNKKQREEAIAKYKQKKMETFQMLSKKTKKGQPNLNLQMDYLLQKIQKTQP